MNKITEIEKKLQKMDKSEILKICRKMKCPTGTKREMIGHLLRPLRKKYKMDKVSSLQDLLHDTMFANFPEYIKHAKEANYPPGFIDMLLDEHEKQRFHAVDDGEDNLREAVNMYLIDPKRANKKYRDISTWDVSKVTNMAFMFQDAKSFNGDISKWDVSNVTNMEGMFQNAESFNGDLSKWDVSNVTNMSFMFHNAKSFNGTGQKNINTKIVNDGTTYTAWDVSKVTNMEFMFHNAESFNGDISKWDVSKVTNMKGMFNNARSFNGDLNTKVVTLDGTTYTAWDVSNVTNMAFMFQNAFVFNGDLSGWIVNNVEDTEKMFQNSRI